ncbi:MAG: hypothetical protein C0436_03825 [Alphaproteobacteria bacterium]|nr:hypothetical protein [Alphaproteobacteria bacterium]
MTLPDIYRYNPAESGHCAEQTAVQGPLFRKPTLLCCGGLKISRDNAKAYEYAHRYAHTGAGLIGYDGNLEADSPIDIVSLGYADIESNLVKEMHDHSRRLLQGDPFKRVGAAGTFARKHLFPLVSDASGNLLPDAEISRNLSNIRILGHSYGGVFAQQMIAALAEHLLEKGMPDASVKACMRHVVLVTAGSPACVGTFEYPPTALHMLNHDDREAMNSVDFRKAAHHLLHDVDGLLNQKGYPLGFAESAKNQKRYAAKPLTILPTKARVMGEDIRYVFDPKSPEFLLYMSQPVFVNALGDVITKPSVSRYLERSNARGEFTCSGDGYHRDETGHQARTYFYFGRKPSGPMAIHAEEHNATMPRMAVASVLINALNHSLEEGGATPPSMDALLTVPTHMAYMPDTAVPYTNLAKAAHYRVRMEVARSTDTKSQNVPQLG